MVARHETTGDVTGRVGGAADALFLTWRRWISRALAAFRDREPARRALPAVRSRLALLARFLRDPRSATTDAERRTLARAGAAALASGSVLAIVLAPLLRVPPAEAAIAVTWTLGWALLRLGILRLAAPRVAPVAVRYAWAAGLLPALVAVTDPVRLVALAASAWLTLGALEGSSSRREARRAVAWAFGAEVAAAAVRWVASGVLLYVLGR